MDYEKRGYVNFVEGITFFVYFQDAHGHTFRKLLKKSVPCDMQFVWHRFGEHFLIFGLILRVVRGFRIDQKRCSKIKPKRDPGGRAPG